MMPFVSADDAYAALADAEMDQYFLVVPEKLAIIIEAAGILPTDRVVEVGAGVGTVARSLPPCASLTVVELDSRLIDELRKNVPGATVINGDGVALLREGEITGDVILGNLPWSVTQSLVELLPQLDFRTAVFATGSPDALDGVSRDISSRMLTTIEGDDDFTPSQPARSYLLRAERRR